MMWSFVTRLLRAPALVGLIGTLAVYLLADSASAGGFGGGVLVVTLALFLSGAFYMRVQMSHRGLMLFRLVVALALKWSVVVAGAWWALARGGLPAAPFTFGVIAALVATLFGLSPGSKSASSS